MVKVRGGAGGSAPPAVDFPLLKFQPWLPKM